MRKINQQNAFMKWAGTPTARAFAALILMLIIGAVFNGEGSFFKSGTHIDTLRYISRFAIMACGMTLVIIAGGIDLSTGSVLGLSAVTFSLFTIHWNWSPFIAIPACLGIGLACGLVSGALISKFRLQPFIATLAIMVFARGLAKFITGGEKVTTAIKTADGSYEYAPEPKIFEFLNDRILGDSVFMVTIILVLCVLLCWILLNKVRYGRYIYAIGGNEESSRLSGIPVTFTKLMAYGLCGLFSALAGICQAAEEVQGDPEAGQGYELTAIAIVVIGGTSLNGGRGGILLTVLGALTIGYLEKILSINAIGEPTRLMLTGLIIVCAVIFQRSKKHG